MPAVHVCDAARVFRRALESGEAGARYHAVAEEGVTLREIAEVIGAGLRLPVESITPEETPDYYGWLAQLATLDLPPSDALTRQQLDWVPTGPGLLTDLRTTTQLEHVAPIARITAVHGAISHGLDNRRR